MTISGDKGHVSTMIAALTITLTITLSITAPGIPLRPNNSWMLHQLPVYNTMTVFMVVVELSIVITTMQPSKMLRIDIKFYRSSDVSNYIQHFDVFFTCVKKIRRAHINITSLIILVSVPIGHINIMYA